MRSFIGLVKTILLLTLPAALSLWAGYQLFLLGYNEHSLVAWILLFFLVPPAFVLSLVALIVNLAIFSGFVLYLLGRRGHVQFYTNSHDFREIFRRPPRDVTPTTPNNDHLLN